jgi:hypothetical protein
MFVNNAGIEFRHYCLYQLVVRIGGFRIHLMLANCRASTIDFHSGALIGANYC